jgi:hypothetical protein
VKNPSVYKEFGDWMFNCNINSVLREDISHKITNLYILKLLMGLDDITVAINDVFNTYDISTLDVTQFATYIKKIIIRNNISKKSISHLKYLKKDVIATKCIHKLVHIKNHEVSELMNYINNHNDKIFMLDYLDITPLNKNSKKRRKSKK